MKVSNKQSNVLYHAIKTWEQDNLLTSAQAQALKESIIPLSFNWKLLAKYLFWISIACIIIAMGAMVADKFFQNIIEKLFSNSPIRKCIILSVISASLYYTGMRRREKFPEKHYSNETFFFLGTVISTAAIYQLGEHFSMMREHLSSLLLISFLLYGVLGLYLQSKLVWLFSILSLGSWFGAETGYCSGCGVYFLGMNYPLRFILFGTALTAIASLLLPKISHFKSLTKTTLIMGLLYLFIALWILSLFGNSDFASWKKSTQIELFLWSFLWAGTAALSTYIGIKLEDGIFKGFGLTFLFLNLYTRYFEYFWSPLYKPVFFLILGLSLWLLASKIERLWLSKGFSIQK